MATTLSGETVVGAAPERFRWAAELAAALVAQAEPTDYARGLRRLEATMEYMVWHAREATVPFDVKTVLHPEEFLRYSEFRWDDDAVGLAVMVLVAARAHCENEPSCQCVLHRPAPFDTGTKVADALALAATDGAPESAGVLARLTLRHPWDWAGEAAVAALDLADAAGGIEHAAPTVGALAHYAGPRQGQRLSAVDAFSPEALDDFARLYRWSSGFNLELDRLPGVLVALHVSEHPDCTCVLCTPYLADFDTSVLPYSRDDTFGAGAWVVRAAAGWGIAAGTDSRLVLAAAQHLTLTAHDHPEAVGAGIDLNVLVTCGAHRSWPIAGDLEFSLLTAMARHRWESGCQCLLCGAPKLRK